MSDLVNSCSPNIPVEISAAIITICAFVILVLFYMLIWGERKDE